MATATTLPPMPEETLVFTGFWELSWMGSEWTMGQRIEKRRHGIQVHRDQKRVGFVNSRREARALIKSIVEKEQG